MLAEIVTIGDEMLEGQTLNTNAAFLGRALFERGYEITRHCVLADSRAAIVAGLKEALSRADFVIATGGLGPTIDDLTKSAAADLFGAPLKIDQKLYAELKTRYADSDALHNQALVPEGAIQLRNRVGSASGFLFFKEKVALFLLPGPPREMEPMFMEEVVPLLERHFSPSGAGATLRLSLCMLQELDIDPTLREIAKEHPDILVGIYPSYGTLQVRFKVSERKERLAHFAERMRQQFPTHLFEGTSIAEALHRVLIEKGKTVALAESCTGGAISERLAAMADASKYLLGSLVVYSNEWKRQFLGVQEKTLQIFGAVSREAVVEMVQGLFAKTGADYAVAVSGIAGPTGGCNEKPVGTVWIAVGERSDLIDAGKMQLQPIRSTVIEHSVQTSLSALYRRVAYNKMSFS